MVVGPVVVVTVGSVVVVIAVVTVGSAVVVTVGPIVGGGQWLKLDLVDEREQLLINPEGGYFVQSLAISLGWTWESCAMKYWDLKIRRLEPTLAVRFHVHFQGVMLRWGVAIGTGGAATGLVVFAPKVVAVG